MDLAVIRDRLGTITAVEAYRKGDLPFDRRTKEIERSHSTLLSAEAAYGNVVIESTKPINFRF